MKLSEWIKKERNEAEEVFLQQFKNNLTEAFKNGHTYALDRLQELLESKGIDLEIPDKREKF